MNHLYAFPTLPTRLYPHELQNVVANLIAHDVWFEFNPDEENHVIRVRSEHYPLLAKIREGVQP